MVHRLNAPEMKFKISPETIRVQTTGNNAEPKDNFYQPEIALPLKIIKTDLTKTLAVTILALLLQIGLYVYLQRGGWPIILSMLKHLAI